MESFFIGLLSAYGLEVSIAVVITFLVLRMDNRIKDNQKVSSDVNDNLEKLLSTIERLSLKIHHLEVQTVRLDAEFQNVKERLDRASYSSQFNAHQHKHTISNSGND